MLLETESAATARGATVYGEILGGSSTSEAKGIFSVRKDGVGLAKAIDQSLQRANLTANTIGMVTAHGNGTTLSDASEALAIKKTLGAHTVPVTGFKWSIGHTIAASGVIESILTLLALREKQVPGMPAFNQLAEDCSGLRVSQTTQPALSSIGLVVSRAFAGINTCVLLRAC